MVPRNVKSASISCSMENTRPSARKTRARNSSHAVTTFALAVALVTAPKQESVLTETNADLKGNVKTKEEKAVARGENPSKESGSTE